MKKSICLILLLLTLVGILPAVDQKVSQLATATTIQDSSYFYLIQSGSKKVTAATVKSYALGGHTIGGTLAADITTNNGTQTLTNKTLTAPVLGGTAMTSTGAELNILDGAIVSTAELNYLDGCSSNLQTQINALTNETALQFRTYQYTTSWVQSGTSKTIAESVILTALSNPIHYWVSPHIDIEIWSIDSNNFGADPNAAPKYTVTGTEIIHLNTITLSGLTDAATYAVVVTFRLVPDNMY